jgi:hypothetical protein
MGYLQDCRHDQGLTPRLWLISVIISNGFCQTNLLQNYVHSVLHYAFGVLVLVIITLPSERRPVLLSTGNTQKCLDFYHHLWCAYDPKLQKRRCIAHTFGQQKLGLLCKFTYQQLNRYWGYLQAINVDVEAIVRRLFLTARSHTEK